MTYSVIDVETTGLSANRGDRILEIGVVKLTGDGKITETLDTLVNPGRRVSATRVHGITDSMVEEAPVFRDLIPRLFDELHGTVVAAHNASFDVSFLNQEIRRAGVKVPEIKPVCTLILARRYLSRLPSRSLAACRRYLNLPDDGAHSALADAKAAAELLRYFVNHHSVYDSPVFRSPGGERREPELFGSLVCLKPRNEVRSIV